MMGAGGYGLMAGLRFAMVIGLLVWVGLIALVVWGAGALFGGRGGGAEETPGEILRRRYARGEISQAEYEQARQALA